ncbi:MAG TPA: four-carbon acid sugar kinase family protein, partial [Rhodopila sp.]|nr:four-carbon acid sugar kinase family protein [Rhodopila sp.]
MTILRLLADDLTGALDTAAELVPLTGAVPVFWPPMFSPSVPPSRLAGNAALDSATREASAADAMATVRQACRHLDGADLAFKKIDSLMRGSTLAEVAACLHSGIWRHAVLAPAFPFQDRITRDGRQYARQVGTWTAVSGDLAAGLQALGVPAERARPGEKLRPGVNVFDAEDDAALRAVAG